MTDRTSWTATRAPQMPQPPRRRRIRVGGSMRAASRVALVVLFVVAAACWPLTAAATALRWSPDDANTDTDGDSSSASAALGDEVCVAPCASLHRVTVACAISPDGRVTTTCGKCLPGFDGAASSVTIPCVVNDDYWTGDEDDESGGFAYPGSEGGYYHGGGGGSAMSIQATLGSALGSVIVLLMCVITWRGWLDCCSKKRKHECHRAFLAATTKEWTCAVCLHENSSLRRRCVMCKTEFHDPAPEEEPPSTTAETTTAPGDDPAYSLLRTPRASTRSKGSQGFGDVKQAAAASAFTDEQQIASERLEWKRCINKNDMKWLRFHAADVRSYPQLRGTIVSMKGLASLDLFSKNGPMKRAVGSAASVDGFFVLLSSQAVTVWSPAEHATFDSRRYKQWRGLQKNASASFDDRLRWFYQEAMKLRHPMLEDKFTIHVHRQQILKQTMQLFQSAPSSLLRRHLRVDFMDEPGVDGGGILREWLQLVCRELFSESLGIFKRTASSVDNGYWIRTEPGKPCRDEIYKFFGQLLAKTMLEGLVLSVRLATPLLKYLLDSPLSKEDLRFVDEQIYSSVCYLQENDNIDQLCLTFSVADTDLISHGSEIAVTDINKRRYVDHLVQYYLFDSIEHELGCIKEGFRSVLPDTMLHIFDHKELDLVVSGLAEIDVLDWQAHTNVCLVGHHPEKEEQVVDWFWEIVEQLDQRERSRLLQYVTGSSGVPVEGFSALTSLDGRLQHFTIQLTENLPTTYTAMPYASTCFNRLDLPVYKQKEDLEQMLRVVSA